ncbi:hypothetical protein RRG08_011424 [Elysia crispata]|uniref:Uncharacterized protein n=1 Tax=Elysia crispata TaxID=231223 RepID=A0AAE1AFY6_9GAST|nr:hypothetical protein RRG08_011424 [Elysia crispata]
MLFLIFNKFLENGPSIGLFTNLNRANTRAGCSNLLVLMLEGTPWKVPRRKTRSVLTQGEINRCPGDETTCWTRISLAGPLQSSSPVPARSDAEGVNLNAKGVNLNAEGVNLNAEGVNLVHEHQVHGTKTRIMVLLNFTRNKFAHFYPILPASVFKPFEILKRVEKENISGQNTANFGKL